MKMLKILCILYLACIPSIVKADVHIPSKALILEENRIINEIEKEKATDESYLVCKEEVYIPYQIVRVTRSAIALIKYVVPILLIFMGMLDFGKVVLGKPDEEMKKAKSSFLSRLIAGILVFLVVNIVEMVMQTISTNDENIKCIKCIVTEEDCKYVNISHKESTVPSPTPKQTEVPNSSKIPTKTEPPVVEEKRQTGSEEKKEVGEEENRRVEET